MTDFHHTADLINALYNSGAVDLERTTRCIGFERKPLRTDTHRSAACGGSGFPIDAGYIYEDDLGRAKKGKAK